MVSQLGDSLKFSSRTKIALWLLNHAKSGRPFTSSKGNESHTRKGIEG